MAEPTTVEWIAVRLRVFERGTRGGRVLLATFATSRTRSAVEAGRNARLCAAAPDLLSALLGLMVVHPPETLQEERAHAIARKAVAKARGEEGHD